MQKRVAPLAFAARAAATTASRSSSASLVDSGVVALRLRAVAAVLRAAAGLDREQRRQLHGVRRVVRAVHLLRAVHELGERQREQRLDRRDGPARPARRPAPRDTARSQRRRRGSCVRRMALRRPRGSELNRAIGRRRRSSDGYNRSRVSREVRSLSNRPQHRLTAPLAARAAAGSAWRTWAQRATRLARDALPQACALCAADAGARLLCAACAAALPRLPRRAPSARCRRRTPRPAAPASRIRRRTPRRQPRSSTRSRSTACCSSSSTRVGSRWPTGRRASSPRPPRRRSPRDATRRRPDLVAAVPLSADAPARARLQPGARDRRPRARSGWACRSAHALEREARGAPQAALPWSRRAANVRGAFACRRDVGGLAVALVDDVMTTGRHAGRGGGDAAARGRRSGRGWVVARTLPPAAA